MRAGHEKEEDNEREFSHIGSPLLWCSSFLSAKQISLQSQNEAALPPRVCDWVTTVPFQFKATKLLEISLNAGASVFPDWLADAPTLPQRYLLIRQINFELQLRNVL
jgi:hypothetical protein